MGEENKGTIGQNCKDCVIEQFQIIIQRQFAIITTFLYVISAMALVNNSAEVLQNVLGLIK